MPRIFSSCITETPVSFKQQDLSLRIRIIKHFSCVREKLHERGWKCRKSKISSILKAQERGSLIIRRKTNTSIPSSPTWFLFPTLYWKKKATAKLIITTFQKQHFTNSSGLFYFLDRTSIYESFIARSCVIPSPSSPPSPPTSIFMS